MPIGNSINLFHNGTIPACKTQDDQLSDTAILGKHLENLLPNLVEPHALLSEAFKPFLQQFAGDSINRLVLQHNDNYTIINEHLGEWIDGVWYSNDYYKRERITTTVITQPTATLKKVFVYGTLKQGERNNYLLLDSKLIGKATSLFEMAMTNGTGHYPYCYGEHPNGYEIEGEIYQVTDKIMETLDKLEGYPTHYTRKETLFVADTGVETAWIYLINKKYNNEPLLKTWMGGVDNV